MKIRISGQWRDQASTDDASFMSIRPMPALDDVPAVLRSSIADDVRPSAAFSLVVENSDSSSTDPSIISIDVFILL